MMFMLDQGVARSAADVLRASGHDAVHVADVGLGESPDEEIVLAATSPPRVIVSVDADFHAIIAISGKAGPSCIRLRIQRLKGPDVAAWVLRVVGAFGDSLETGVLVTVDEAGTMRMRALPISRRA